MTKPRIEIRGSAALSKCHKFRWWLRREWDEGNGDEVCFIMLNPSTADALKDDPTIRRCIGFARDWGYSRLVVRNLYPYRTPSPAVLRSAGFPTGGERGDQELEKARESHLVICAWGANAPRLREAEVRMMLEGVPLFSLGVTAAGRPKHPLYIPASKPFERWPPKEKPRDENQKDPGQRD